MGIESPAPVINDQVLQRNFTNEGGVGNTIRLLKNITGLWLVQECRRAWSQGGADLDLGGPQPAGGRGAAAGFLHQSRCGRFHCRRRTCRGRSRDFCAKTGQTVPQDEGAVLRCALDSLAMKFRHVLGMCEELAGGRIETIHIVGGGTQNRLLCQAAADASGRRVVAGPVEATAIGNIMVQAVADGAVGSIAEAREVVRRSFDVEEYEPQNRPHGTMRTRGS